MIVYHDVEQGTPEWKKMRRGLWSGSIALRLLQGKSLPVESDWGGNDATRRGQLLEFATIREYERKYKCKVLRSGGITNTVYPNAWYSPDGIDGGWLLEIKSFVGESYKKLVASGMEATSLEDIIASEIPLKIKVQIFFGMIITGKRKARLLAFNPDIPEQEQLIVIEIGYDKLIGKNIRKKLKQDMKKRQATS